MCFPKLLLYYHSIRHLKLRQIIYRLYYWFGKPIVRRRALASLGDFFVRKWKKMWSAPSYMEQSYFESGEFCFLGEKGRVSSRSDWNNPSKQKLWLYNLHYFDDFNSVGSEARTVLHAELLNRWIKDNPPMAGNGWEPYPLSLRLVNLVKWFSDSGAELVSEDWIANFCRQARALSVQVEYHIQANHLFANGKALVFAGAFLGGDDAARWLRLGLKILDKECKEQFLTDGGHFERTPMYHSILMWDICDLIKLGEISGLEELKARIPLWRSLLERGLGWMEGMTHPDGGIAFFNDSAFGIGPSLEKLRGYTLQAGVSPVWQEEKTSMRIRHFRESGFIAVDLPERGKALLDIGNIGPAYQPGHAHAETLSFELSLFGRRVFVNSGISCYGTGEKRIMQRGTGAHNTVLVDGKNSSEVWSGFRVGRRARVHDLEINDMADKITVACSHDGYRRLPGKVTHRRRWEFGMNRINITDTLSGGYSDARACFHLHPDISVKRLSAKEFSLHLPGGQKANLIFFGAADVQLQDSKWHPRFGEEAPNLEIVVNFGVNSGLNAIKTTIEW